MHGLLVLDKRAGRSSFDEIRALRRLLHERKVGHAGTLDPMATGVLLVCFGAATRLVPWLQCETKTYRATVRVGESTDSDDADGRVVASMSPGHAPKPDELRSILADFEGTISQVPPRVSALKVDGERSYRRARRGEEWTPSPREITIHSIRLLELDWPAFEIEVECGKGTYIRSLARDLGARLGNCAHLSRLRRTSSGPFHVAGDAIAYDELEARSKAGESLPLLSCFEALRDMRSIMLDAPEAIALSQGKRVHLPELAPLALGEEVRAATRAGRLIAIARIASTTDGQAKVLRVVRGMPADATRIA